MYIVTHLWKLLRTESWCERDHGIHSYCLSGQLWLSPTSEEELQYMHPILTQHTQLWEEMDSSLHPETEKWVKLVFLQCWSCVWDILLIVPIVQFPRAGTQDVWVLCIAPSNCFPSSYCGSHAILLPHDMPSPKASGEMSRNYHYLMD